ncbi:paraquat-inducible protein A [Nitratifractor sp.]
MRGIERRLGVCRVCSQLIHFPPPDEGTVAAHCPRCGSEVAPRKPHSVQITWALLIASAIFYIPANLLPMMEVQTFAGTEADTILSGVLYFLQDGSYLIAAVIFVASILVPTFKILVLGYLLLSVQSGSAARTRQRRRLYVLTELIGRWSMVDVYVVSIMVALVHFPPLSEIHAREGAIFFLLVVILTMLAAMSFDPRLIRDAAQKEKHA